MGRLWVTINGKRKRTAAGIKHQKDKWESNSEWRAKHNARLSARREAIKKGKVRRNDGKDIDHLRGVSAGNGSSNLRVMSASENRGRTQGSRKRGSKRNKSKWGK